MALDNPERLAFVGPRERTHGFPMWYEDATGTRLDLALDNGPLTPAGEQPPHPGAPLSIPDNLPEEGFYFYAESEIAVGGAAGTVGRARLILGLEAAFGGPGTPADDARVVFSRIRVRMDDMTPGAEYVITHPYGVTEPLPADERGRVFWTDDRGIADERLGEVVKVGRVAPFLRSTSAPAGYLGDGVTPTTVTGSPFGTNFFRIDGPGVAAGGGPADPGDPTNPDRVQHALFTVQGRIATRLGAEVARATYARDAGGAVVLDVFAGAAPGQSLELAAPRVAASGADRAYVVRAAVPAVPATATIVNASDVPPSRAQAPVTDLVLVTRADFDAAAVRLTVDATSSDAAGPTLTAVGLGDLTDHPTVFAVAAVPPEVVVTSAAGGRGARAVTLSGAPGAALPVVADAGADRSVVAGATAGLDGTGSRGGVTSYAWVQTAGAAVGLDDPSSPTPSFVAPSAAQSLAFALTVTGPGGPGGPGDAASDVVTVTVTDPPAPDVLVIQRAQYRTSKRQWRVGGAVTASGGPRPNRVTVLLRGAEIGSSLVDATGAWDVRRTLLGGEAALEPTVGSLVHATSEGGGSDDAPVNVRN